MTGAPPEAPPDDVLLGRVVDGRYRIVARLARGGMATVYRAVDTRLDREVALKVMHAGLADNPGFVARFEREARASARLSHPNVVSLHDQGRDGGLIYLVMEYIPGRNVRDLLRERGALSPSDALAIIEPVLKALSAAHEAGFVHRDIKPENILLARDGRIKVTDFGLARAIASPDNQTSHGMLIGTVAYLSPEQVDQGTADPRSDVYSAGILLFELLTGSTPYRAETPLQVAFQHVHSDVPPASSLRSGIPPEVDELVRHATRRPPADRFADAGVFLAGVREARDRLAPSTPLSVLATGPVIDLAGGSPWVTSAPNRTAEQSGPRSGAQDVQPELRGPIAAPGLSIVQGQSVDEPLGQGLVKSSRPLIVLSLLVVLGVLIAFAGHFVGSLRPVTAPNVVGMTVAAAQNAAQKLRLTLEIAGEQFSETVAKGIVMSADPGPGTSVYEGDSLSATVSKGPERYLVPGFVGKSLDEAEGALADNSLTTAGTKQVFSDTVPAGSVAGSIPAQGSALKRGAQVTLLVSKGPKPIPVPNLVGKSLDDATSALASAGLKMTTTEEYSEKYDIGEVVSMKPKAGTEVQKGTEVALVISKGPPPVRIPSVFGKSAREARRILQEAGLKVREDSYGIVVFNLVQTQEPRAGTTVPKGSTVVITIV